MNKSSLLIVLLGLLVVLAGCASSPNPARWATATQRQDYLSAHPDTAPNIASAIRAGTLVAGMTRAQKLAVTAGSCNIYTRTVRSMYAPSVKDRAPNWTMHYCPAHNIAFTSNDHTGAIIGKPSYHVSHNFLNDSPTPVVNRATVCTPRWYGAGFVCRTYQ